MNRRNVLIALTVLTFFMLVTAIVVVVINQTRPSDISVADVCGNGTVDIGEQCDDGNIINGDGCSSTCEIQPLSCANLDNPYIDFESIPGATNEAGMQISDQFKDIYGISFKTGNRRTITGVNAGVCDVPYPILVQKENNEFGGFQGYKGITNNPLPGFEDRMGEWLITTTTVNTGTIPCQLIIDFDYPTLSFSFDIWDIDNSEGWTIRAYDKDNKIVRPILGYLAPVGDLTYNSQPYRFSGEYATPVVRIIVVPYDEKAGGAGFGLAFDRFSPYCENPSDVTSCGDGVVQTPNSNGVDEQCDDGANGVDTDGCNDQCQTTIQCYSCTVDLDDANACDSSTAVGTSCPSGKTGNPNCYEAETGGLCPGPECGNGIVETGETCDDGNTIDTDSCTNACIAPACGDGIVQSGTEECDDGNTDNTDSCTNQCTLSICGDGIIQTPNSDGIQEQCDGGANCNAQCQTEITCYRCTTDLTDGNACESITRNGNACEPGETTNSTACAGELPGGVCPTPVCGNGTVEPGELCDDGNTDNTDSCQSCIPTSCGDGIVQAPNAQGVIEQCEDPDGPDGNDADGCNDQCQQTTNCYSCTADLTDANTCNPLIVRLGTACLSGETSNIACQTAAPGGVCAVPVCGNGILEPGEQCDDGADGIAGNGCNDQCLRTSTCYKCTDALDDVNACDTQIFEATACPSGYTSNSQCHLAATGGACQVPVCGNSVVEPGETCDDGANGNDTDGCNDLCQPTVQCYSCTDILTDSNACNSRTVIGTSCPTGETTNSNCAAAAPGGQCATPQCGNGVVEPGEACDDGNAVDTDACTNSCSTATCGDGIIRAGVEACDDGNTIDTDACSNSCELTICGDSVVQTLNSNGQREQCDDGADGDDTDGCNDSCETTVNCYSCTADLTDGNACNSRVVVGQSCETNETLNNASCEDAYGTNCPAPICGNGVVEPGEICDDGNTNNTDACNTACEPTVCGDGVIQSPNGSNEIEACDDGNSIDTDSCTNSCQTTSCGDGIVQSPNSNGKVEQCDDGNAVDSDGCNSQCETTTQCYKCTDSRDDGNACDPAITQIGNSCPTGYTSSTACYTAMPGGECAGPLCGNGIKEGNEQCDDGNSINTDLCSNNCLATVCGDGVIQKPNSAGQFEVCDDGNTSNSDSCSNSCQKTVCGDGIVQTPNSNGINEQCDDGADGDATDGCNDSCQSTITCFKCTSDLTDGNTCESATFVGITCPSNYTASSDCTALYGGACPAPIPITIAGVPSPFCGNGLVETGEQCDDGNTLNGDGCENNCTTTIYSPSTPLPGTAVGDEVSYLIVLGLFFTLAGVTIYKLGVVDEARILLKKKGLFMNYEESIEKDFRDREK